MEEVGGSRIDLVCSAVTAHRLAAKLIVARRASSATRVSCGLIQFGGAAAFPTGPLHHIRSAMERQRA